MGRTIKVSELKIFDVFKDPRLLDDLFCYVGYDQFVVIGRPSERYWYHNYEQKNEVELLGKMAFTKE